MTDLNSAMYTFGSAPISMPRAASPSSDAGLTSWPGFLTFPALQQQMSDARARHGRYAQPHGSTSSLSAVTSDFEVARQPTISSMVTVTDDAQHRSHGRYVLPPLLQLEKHAFAQSYPSPVSQLDRRGSIGTDCFSLVSTASTGATSLGSNAQPSTEHEHERENDPKSAWSAHRHRKSVDSIDLLLEAAAEWQRKSVDPDCNSDQCVDPAELDLDLDLDAEHELEFEEPGQSPPPHDIAHGTADDAVDAGDLSSSAVDDQKPIVSSAFGDKPANCHWCGKEALRRRLKRGVTFVVGRYVPMLPRSRELHADCSRPRNEWELHDLPILYTCCSCYGTHYPHCSSSSSVASWSEVRRLTADRVAEERRKGRSLDHKMETLQAQYRTFEQFGIGWYECRRRIPGKGWFAYLGHIDEV